MRIFSIRIKNLKGELRNISILIFLYLLFVSPCVFAKEPLSPKFLKHVSGQSGVVFTLGEVFINIRYGNISYTDTDGYGSITKAGIKVRSDGKISTLHFKPLTVDTLAGYTNSDLKSTFGKSIGSIGLTKETLNSAYTVEDMNKFIKAVLDQDTVPDMPISNLTISTTNISPVLTAMNLFNRGLSLAQPAENILKNGNAVGGIVVNLPSIIVETGTTTNDIMIFGGESKNGVYNNNKVLLTIERGSSRTAILGGRIEITPTADNVR